MAETPSNMMPLGSKMPRFSLPDPSGQMHDSSDAKGAKAFLVMFICNHCPYVVRVADQLAEIGRDYAKQGVAIFAISANDAERYPEDGPEEMAKEAKRRGYDFPYLYDQSQEVAKAYKAACTPDLFLFGADEALVYRGQLDAARPSNQEPSDGHSLRAALDAVLAGRPVDPNQRPSLGCSIKWK